MSTPAPRRVLLATCAELPDGEEWAGTSLLPAAFADREIDASWVVWDDPSVDWSSGLVAVRSTWDYETRREEFLVGLRFNLPPEYLLIHRVWLGCIGVLCQVGGTVPIRDLIIAHVPGYGTAGESVKLPPNAPSPLRAIPLTTIECEPIASGPASWTKNVSSWGSKPL